MTKTPEANRRYVKKSHDKRRDFLRWLKSLPCMDCRQTFPPECMDFDHVRGVKLYTIGGRRHRDGSGCDIPMAKLQDEVMKCEVVCSNCHRIRTAARLR